MRIRFLTFQPGTAGEVTDQFLRQAVLPGLVKQPGLRHAHVGRGGTEAGLRIVVSVWDESDAPIGALARQMPFEVGTPVTDAQVELYPARVALAFAPPAGGQILRVFRGRTRPGETELYLDAVRQGTQEDVDAGQGPLALFLGLVDDERFVTASVWSSWQHIEAATGGNIRQPIGTRHGELVLEGSAEHFEIVPNTVVEPAQPSGVPAQLASGLAATG